MPLNWEAVIKDAWTKIQDAVCPCVVGLSWCDQLVEPREGSTIRDSAFRGSGDLPSSD